MALSRSLKATSGGAERLLFSAFEHGPKGSEANAAGASTYCHKKVRDIWDWSQDPLAKAIRQSGERVCVNRRTTPTAPANFRLPEQVI